MYENQFIKYLIEMQKNAVMFGDQKGYNEIYQALKQLIFDFESENDQ
ncbi:hypothetical protein [Bacillus changyiensis]|nr:hypothetical protein [Bacillus changyiensis]MDA1478368.1 hypothetical protein [Bacillus changyiensis]